MSDTSWRELRADLRPGQLHHETWYAAALSSEVEPGAVIGRDFLNGRVAIYRRGSGEPVVLSARCPHMGADLALGDVVGDELRCTYHHFCFAPDGACSRIPSRGPIPPSAPAGATRTTSSTRARSARARGPEWVHAFPTATPAAAFE